MKSNYLIILTIILFTNCREKIELDLPNSDKHALVVEGYVTEGVQDVKVSLRLTTSYQNDGVNPVPNNVSYVILKRNDYNNNLTIDTLKESIKNSGDYILKTSYIPSFRDNYILEIKYNNELFRAESKIGKNAKIDSIYYHYVPSKLFSKAGYEIDLIAKDLPSIGDYYYFEKIKNGKIYYETINDQLTIWDDLISDGLVFPKPVLFGINPRPDDDNPTYDENKEYPYTKGDTITINIYSIDENVYRMYNDMKEQKSSASGGNLGPLFAAPADNIRSNMKNIDPKGSKVVGIFSARGAVTAGVRIK